MTLSSTKIIVALRRLQKYVLSAKVIVLVACLASLGYLIFQTPPELGNIVFLGLLLFIALLLFLSLFLDVDKSLLLSLAVSFLLFLKAVSLLTLFNLALFVVFLVLLALYLAKK
ncbi:MAG: hypothetical protein M1484_05080 [Patescibacteria group bacterium]|nr:hypothetical protein [Patescibacteria group bacterium]MCL5432427.1 hypothetical protein [Patescibacteria group bacterium]